MWPKGATQWTTAVLQLHFYKGERGACRGFWTPNSSHALPSGILILSLKKIFMVPLLVLKSERQGRRFNDLT